MSSLQFCRNVECLLTYYSCNFWLVKHIGIYKIVYSNIYTDTCLFTFRVNTFHKICINVFSCLKSVFPTKRVYVNQANKQNYFTLVIHGLCYQVSVFCSKINVVLERMSVLVLETCFNPEWDECNLWCDSHLLSL